MSWYLNQLQNSYLGFSGMGSGSYGSPYGPRAEDVENSFIGYVNGAYKRNGVIFAIILSRLMLFTEARFMYRRFKDDGTPGELFSDDSLRLLKKPWPNGTTGELLARMEQDVSLSGNFYCVNEGDRLRRLRPDWVSIILSAPPEEAIESDVIGYLYHPNGYGNGVEKAYLPDEVCHFSPIPDPAAQYRGMSWLTPVVEDIQADMGATTHKLNFFRNGATPQVIATLPREMTRQQFIEFREATNSAVTGVSNAYKIWYLGGGADAKVVGTDFRQLDFKVTQGGGETRLCAAGGVPPIIVGLSEGLSSATYSNYGMARRKFGDHWARPQWRMASASLASIVAEPNGSELWYDDRDIAFLREDAQDQANISQTLMATINSGITAGFVPDEVVKYVNPAWAGMKHSGLTSVQLSRPGSEAEMAPDTNGNGMADDSQAPDGGSAPDFGALRADFWEFDEDDVLRAVEDLFGLDEDELERARYDVRVAEGHVGGGRFRKLSDVAAALLQDWAKGDGPDDPLDQFDAPQLRRILGDERKKALEAGDHDRVTRLTPRRGATPDQLKTALYEDVRGAVRQHRDTTEKPSAKFTLQGAAHRDLDVAVYRDSKGKPALFREGDSGKRGSLVERFGSLDEMAAWADEHDEPKLADWARKEATGKPSGAMKAPAKATPRKSGPRSAAPDPDALDGQLRTAKPEERRQILESAATNQTQARRLASQLGVKGVSKLSRDDALDRIEAHYAPSPEAASKANGPAVDLDAFAAASGGRDAFADGGRNYLDEARRDLDAGQSPASVADRLNEQENAIAKAGPFDAAGRMEPEREALVRRLNTLALKLRSADPKTRERKAADAAAWSRFKEIETNAGTDFHWGTVRAEGAASEARRRWLAGDGSKEIASDLRRQADDLDRFGVQGRLTSDHDMTGVLQHEQGARDRAAIGDAKGLRRLADAIDNAGPLRRNTDGRGGIAAFRDRNIGSLNTTERGQVDRLGDKDQERYWTCVKAGQDHATAIAGMKTARHEPDRVGAAQFRDAHVGDLGAFERQQVDRLSADDNEAYWTRRAEGLDHGTAIQGMATVGPAGRPGAVRKGVPRGAKLTADEANAVLDEVWALNAAHGNESNAPHERLMELSVSQLRSLAEQAGISEKLSGTKADMADSVLWRVGTGDIRSVSGLSLAGQTTLLGTRSKGLSAASKSALSRYASNDITPARINGRLRTRKPLTAEIERIDEAMAVSHTSEDVLLYRGVHDASTVLGLPGGLPEDLVGHEWTEPGFSSTTQRRGIAEVFSSGDDAVLFEIRVPAGTHAARLPGGEDEVLLDRGLTYRVVEDRIQTTMVVMSGEIPFHKRILVVEVVPAATPKAPNPDGLDSTGGPSRRKQDLAVGQAAVANAAAARLPEFGDLTLVRDPRWSGAEKDALQRELRQYAGSGYLTVNPWLTGETERFEGTEEAERMRPAVEAQIARLDRVLDASPLDRDVQVWRGMRSGRGTFGDALAGDLTGFRWHQDSYGSTSASEKHAFAFAGGSDAPGIMMRVRVPAGTGAIYIEGAADELLLQRGLDFRVVADHGVADHPGQLAGLRRLDVEVVPSPNLDGLDFTGARPRPSSGLPSFSGHDGIDVTDEEQAAYPSLPNAQKVEIDARLKTGTPWQAGGQRGTFFGTHPDRGVEVSPERQAEIRAAIEEIAYRDGTRYGTSSQTVTMQAVREGLGDRFPRAEVDNVIQAMNRTPDWNVTPEVNQKMLTPRERLAAVVIGNQDKHSIIISKRGPAPSVRPEPRPVAAVDFLDRVRTGEDAGLSPEDAKAFAASGLSLEEWRAQRSEPFDEDDIERAEADEDEDLDEALRAMAVGGDEFQAYWTRGKGLKRWSLHPHPWTKLRNLLRKHPGIHDAEGLASHYFHVVFGFWPGDRKGDNPVGPG